MRIPIRFKILILTLVILTTVLSLITFTMARLFHADKEIYVRDLTSIVAQHTASEARTVLHEYSQKLQVFTSLVYQDDLGRRAKSNLVNRLFRDYRDFISISIFENDREQVTFYDRNSLTGTGLTRDALKKYSSEHPIQLEDLKKSGEYVANSTISRELPLITLAIKPNLPGSSKVVAVAVIRMDRLYSISGRSRVLDTFIVSPKGEIITHANTELIASHGKAAWVPESEVNKDIPVIGTTINYVRSDEDMIGSLYRVGFGGLVAVAEIPASAAFLSTRELLNSLMIVALLLLSFFTVAGLFWSKRLTRPIELLSKAAGFIGSGQFDVKVEHASGDEMGELADSFNLMATELKTRADALQDAQYALVHSEKMSAFGQMSAGIAHEVKNPLAGILGYVQLSKRKLDAENPIMKNLDIIEKETRRCTDIINNLMRFARQERTVYGPLDVNKTMDEALDLVDHQLSMKQIRIEKNFTDDLPEVMGNANQLQQVIMNFSINSQHAMEKSGGGVFRVDTRMGEDGYVEIEVGDTGPGIPEDIRDKIFEPFFTTKRAGEGTGLGLAVTYGIIKEHGGDIVLLSEPGTGARFVITLPVLNKDDGISNDKKENGVEEDV